jgi:proteasome lid subunit RPN8/RPN11
MTGIPETFTLAPEIVETLLAYQQFFGSGEVCGLCAVDDMGLQHFLALRNYAADPHRFETSVADEAVALRVAANWAWRILAFVHTHPGGSPNMSGHDAVSIYRDALPWVIVGINGTTVEQRTYLALPLK